MNETERLIRILEQDNPAALYDNAEALAAKTRTLYAFWKVVDSYLARGGDAADYLPLDILAAWQNVITGKVA